MNDTSYKTIFCCLLLGFTIVFGIASSEDYNQAVIESIPAEAYAAITDKLGKECTNGDIVTEYKTNKEYYNKNFTAWDR